jgi:hypothetical protein
MGMGHEQPLTQWSRYGTAAAAAAAAAADAAADAAAMQLATSIPEASFDTSILLGQKVSALGSSGPLVSQGGVGVQSFAEPAA